MLYVNVMSQSLGVYLIWIYMHVLTSSLVNRYVNSNDNIECLVIVVDTVQHAGHSPLHNILYNDYIQDI